MINIAFVSGGKDSTAGWLWMRRTGLNPLPLYNDTLWEWKGHASHLDNLERLIGPIRARTKPLYGFAEGVLKHGIFPHRRMERWCTPELKMQPGKAELTRIREDFGDDIEVFAFMRREESAKRERMVEREWSDFYDCYINRPLLDWTVAQVIEEHRTAKVPMHPLYHHGADRVGCFPCIGAGRAEIALVALLQPERIEEIAELERLTGGTMFVLEETAQARRDRGVGPDEPRKVFPTPIHDMVKWATGEWQRSKYQLKSAPSGCAKWGVCEAPSADVKLLDLLGPE